MSKMIFTDAASTHVQKILSADTNKVFRLTIKKTGCSGYSYHPELVEAARLGDTPMTLSNKIEIYLDTSWLHLFNEMTVDFVEENKNGLKQKRLVFINPTEASRCGCGESFHLAEEVKNTHA